MIKYVYICSAGHSGSTLLDLILGSHSKIKSLGEVSHLPKNITLNTKCSCGSDVVDCPMWNPVIAKLGEDLGVSVFDNPYALNTGYPKATTVVDKSKQTPLYLLKRKFVHGLIYLEQRYSINIFQSFKQHFYKSIVARFNIYNAVREHENVDIVIDSSKTYLEALSLYMNNPDEMRIILLSRDGRGVMYSNMKRNLGRKNGLVGWLHYYSRFITLMDRHIKPEHVLNVHYEDMAENTENVIKNICHFFDLDYEKSMLDFSSSEHHITNGNDMRFSATSEIKLDTAWKKKLSEDDFKYFEKKAGELNRKMGYHQV